MPKGFKKYQKGSYLPEACDAKRKIEEKMADTIDAIAEFEEFSKTILPVLQQDIQAGMSANDLREKYAGLAQGRLINIALTGDSKAAVSAIKDILDRAHGRATEKIEITKKYENMTDDELNDLLESQLKDVIDIESKRADEK